MVLYQREEAFGRPVIDLPDLCRGSVHELEISQPISHVRSRESYWSRPITCRLHFRWTIWNVSHYEFPGVIVQMWLRVEHIEGSCS